MTLKCNTITPVLVAHVKRTATGKEGCDKLSYLGIRVPYQVALAGPPSGVIARPQRFPRHQFCWGLAGQKIKIQDAFRTDKDH